MVSGISYNNGRHFIYSRKKLKFEKKWDFGGNLWHARQSHCPRKFFSTLENLLSRDIVSICFYSHILMNLQYSGNSNLNSLSTADS